MDHDSKIIRYLSSPGHIRAVWLNSQNACQDVVTGHQLSGDSARHMAECLMAGVLLAHMHERGEEVNLRWDFPIGRALVDARPEGKIRGHFKSYKQKIDLAGCVLNVLYTRKAQKELPYQGVVDLPTGEVDRDLQNYFIQSQQITTAVAFRVQVRDGQVQSAKALMVQVLGGATPQEADIVKNLSLQNLRSSLDLEEEELVKHLSNLMPGYAFAPVDSGKIETFCTCSSERIKVALAGSEGTDKGPLEVICQFCGQKYMFG